MDKADFAGWSFGGLTTLTFALAYPERVRSLTLIEPPAFRVLRSRGPFSGEMREERALFQRIAQDDVSEEDLAAFAHAVGLLPEDEDPRTLSQWPVWNEHRQSLRNANVPYEHDIDLDRVRELAKPALLVKGEGSTASLHAIIDILAEALPEAQVVRFPGGHAPHIVSMQPFLETFTHFLQANEDADGRI
jgi:pimeloyl-ACP methyl ester carboxylesterase